MTGAVAALLLTATLVLVLRRRATSSSPDPRRELSTVAMHLARSMRDGQAPAEAWRRCSEQVDGTVGEALRGVSSATRRGVALEDAVTAWAEGRRRDPGHARRGRTTDVSADDVAVFASAVRFGLLYGGDLPRALDGVSVALLDRAEVADEEAAATSQARLSVLVLCGLPVVGLVLLGIVEPGMVTVLLTTGAGRLCAAVALALDLSAYLTSRRMVAVALR